VEGTSRSLLLVGSERKHEKSCKRNLAAKSFRSVHISLLRSQRRGRVPKQQATLAFNTWLRRHISAPQHVVTLVDSTRDGPILNPVVQVLC